MLKSLREHAHVAWSIVGITLLFFLTSELFSSVFLVVKRRGTETIDYRVKADGYYGADWVEAYFKEFDTTENKTWTPYVYWRRRPFAGNYINVNEMGIRRTWNPDVPKGVNGSNHIKIFMFGGSTMWGTGARDDYTISSIVSRSLSKEYGIDVSVTNFGESGYVSTQEVIMLMRELQ